MRRIVNSNIVLAVLIATIIFLLQSCKKTDHFQQGSNEEYEQMFFMGSNNTHDIVTRIARSMQAQNSETPYVASMAINEGFAKWNKAMMETNGTDSIVLLPLVLKGTQYVNSFLVSKLNGGTINITLVQGKNYTKYGYDGDKMALLFMHLNKAVFGATIFDATNSTVFSIGEVEEKMGKRSIQIGFYTREEKIGARSLLTTSSTSLNTLELIAEDPASVLIKKCSGVVYMQDGLIVSTSGDLSCGPTIVELPSQPGTPLVPTEPIPVGPTAPTTPTGGDPATSYPPVKPIIKIPEPIVEDSSDIKDSIRLSILHKYALAISKKSDSIFNISNKSLDEWGMIIVKNEKDSIYGKNEDKGNQIYMKINYSKSSNETLLGEEHTHPNTGTQTNPLDRSAPTTDDLLLLKKFISITNYVEFINCGNVRYAFMIENSIKARSYTNLYRLKIQQIQLFEKHYSIANKKSFSISNWQLATELALIELMGFSDNCGIGFYKSDSNSKTNFTKLN